MEAAPIRVVYVTKALGSGGTHKVVEVFAENINKNLFDLSIVAIYEGGIREEYLRSCGHDVTILGSPDKLGGILLKKSPEIVHLHGSGFNDTTIRELKSASVPNVVMTDNFGWPNRSEVDSIAVRYFFVSDMTRSRFFKLFSVSREYDTLSKYQRMYNPLARSDIEHSESSELRERLGIEPDTPVIGKIGREDADSKWSQIVINAFERVASNMPEVTILLVNPTNKIKRRIESRGLDNNCRYIDSIPHGEVFKFYDSIDVMGHSSKIGESFGYVVAEALARGTPVVVNSTPMRDNAQIELVSHGKTGYIANSSKSFADAIVELLENETKRESFGEAARKHAKNNFGPERITERLEQEYLRLTGHLAEDVPESILQLDEFESKYKKRLKTSFGRPSWSSMTEYLAWRFVSEVPPVGRSPAYHLLRYKRLPQYV